MIKNDELYSFQAEDGQPPAAVESEALEARSENRGLLRLINQMIVSAMTLILIMTFGKAGQPWSDWLRDSIHHAVNAPAEATFGRLWRSEPLQSLIENGRNLVRLEPIVNVSAPADPAAKTRVFPNPVWPVKGNIVKGFGWSYDPSTHTREFSRGVEISAQADAEVYAVASGVVTEVIHRPDQAWSITIDHGNGWRSIYRQLGKAVIQAGEQVSAGSIIGRLGPGNNGSGDPVLQLEMTQTGQPIDPLSVI
jgi:murein DD-endopeptidase MepM/ murein hydrolase activator NlpD